MTPLEFQKAHRDATRTSARLTAALVLIANVAALVFYSYTIRALRHALGDLISLLVVIVALAPPYIFLVWVCRLIDRRIKRANGLLCPFCDAELNDKIPLVMATRTCSHCGNHIFGDIPHTQ